MIQLCAIDPDVMGEWRWFNFLEPHFGVPTGRLIAEFPKDWRRRVMERSESLVTELGADDNPPTPRNKPVQHLRLVERMKADAFKRKVVPAGRNFDENMTFQWNAKGAGFDFVIVPGDRDRENVWGVEVIEFGPHGVNTVRQRDVLKTHDETFGCARHLLERARRVILVDPYFSILSAGWSNAAVKLLSLLPVVRQHDCRVEIHTQRKDKHDSVEHRRLWKSKFWDTLPPRTDLRAVYWDELPGKEPVQGRQAMHPRYLLTDRGGLHYDHGFDAMPGQYQQVTLLDDAYWQRLYEMFDSDRLPEGFDPANCLIR
jgi:hypothetical protein